MKKKHEFTFRQEVLLYMPLLMLKFLIKEGLLTEFLDKANDYHNFNFLARLTYWYERRHNTISRSDEVRISMLDAFAFDSTWWRHFYAFKSYIGLKKMSKHLLNDTSKTLLLVLIIVCMGIFLYNNYIREIPAITTTELIIKYKGYIIVDKTDYKRKNVYHLTLRNPYTNKDIDIRVLSVLYFNYYIGDTIGTKKQKFNY